MTPAPSVTRIPTCIGTAVSGTPVGGATLKAPSTTEIQVGGVPSRENLNGAGPVPAGTRAVKSTCIAGPPACTPDCTTKSGVTVCASATRSTNPEPINSVPVNAHRRPEKSALSRDFIPKNHASTMPQQVHIYPFYCRFSSLLPRQSPLKSVISTHIMQHTDHAPTAIVAGTSQ